MCTCLPGDDLWPCKCHLDRNMCDTSNALIMLAHSRNVYAVGDTSEYVTAPGLYFLSTPVRLAQKLNRVPYVTGSPLSSHQSTSALLGSLRRPVTLFEWAGRSPLAVDSISPRQEWRQVMFRCLNSLSLKLRLRRFQRRSAGEAFS